MLAIHDSYMSTTSTSTHACVVDTARCETNVINPRETNVFTSSHAQFQLFPSSVDALKRWFQYSQYFTIWAISAPSLCRFRQNLQTMYSRTFYAPAPTFKRRCRRVARPSPKQFHHKSTRPQAQHYTGSFDLHFDFFVFIS